jgi:sugar phosphate isomerase/epimerase
VVDSQPYAPLPARPRPAGPPEPATPRRAPRLALSTMWGIGRLTDLGELVDEIRRLGLARIELNFNCLPPMVEQIIGRLGDDVRITSLHNVCPWPVDDDGRAVALPSLAEPDPLAREIIVRWTEETIRLASYWGVPAVVLHLGEIPFGRELEAEVHRLYRAGQHGTPTWQAALDALAAHREAVAGPYREAAWRSLDDLLLLAEEAGVRLGVETRADLIDLPNFAEMGQVLDRFDSEALGYWHDTGHAQRQATLVALAPSAWLDAFGDRLVGCHLHDCAGLDDHLAPGTGAVDFAAVRAVVAPDTPCVGEFHNRLGEAEVAAGLTHLRAVGFEEESDA